MKKEKSCGAVVYKVIDNIYYFLIEKMKAGHYSLPKGHVEDNESEVQTAYREIKEETNLDVIIDEKFKETITYSPYENCIKDVVFFIAEAKSENIVNQECEVSEISFLPFDKAYKKLTHNDDKNVLTKAYLYLIIKNINKIVLIGSPGSGKSYLSKYLHKATDLPLYHLDNLYWYGNWKHINKKEFVKIQKDIMKTKKWIIDGHFQSTIKDRIKNTEVIIHFNLSGITCVNGVKHRIKNHSIREDMPQSCVEKTLDKKFETCMLNFKKEKNKDVFKYLRKYPHNILTITSKKQLRIIVDYLSKSK